MHNPPLAAGEGADSAAQTDAAPAVGVRVIDDDELGDRVGGLELPGGARTTCHCPGGQG